MSWSLIGTKTFTPDDLSEVVGNFSLDEKHDTIWVRITQTNGEQTSPWSYGILTWESSEGYELGSVRAYGHAESEVFRLGVGRAPLDRSGRIVFTPRAFNLGWVRNGFPWTLKFEAQSGQSSSNSDQSLAAVSNGFVDTADNGLSLVRVNFP